MSGAAAPANGAAHSWQRGPWGRSLKTRRTLRSIASPRVRKLCQNSSFSTPGGGGRELIALPSDDGVSVLARRSPPDARMTGMPLALAQRMTHIVYRDGPRHGTSEMLDGKLPVIVGDGSEGGVYQQTDTVDDGAVVYRWQPLTDAEANALVRGDLRANQS